MILSLSGIKQLAEKEETVVHRYGCLEIRCRIYQCNDGFGIGGEILNTNKTDIMPGDVEILSLSLPDQAPYELAHIVCKDMLGFCGPQELDRQWVSYGVCGLTDKAGENALLIQFEDVSDYFYHFIVNREVNGSIRLEVRMPFERIALKGGETVSFSDILVREGADLSQLLNDAASCLALHMNEYHLQYDERLTGFCTWYSHYGTENQQAVREMVNVYAQSPMKDKLEYFLIDGGWNEDEGQDSFNWGDWEAGSKFPEGMKSMAAYIRDRGFKPGLWIAPFSVTSNSSIYREHKDWLTGKGEDLLNNNGEAYGLDLTHPEVQEYVSRIISRIFDEWGYDYIKIDFLLYGALAGERYDNQKTSAMAFREGLRIIRKCAGDRLVLNCGSPLFQSVGMCDSMRIGPDVGSHWFFPLNTLVWQYGNCCVKAGMRYILHNHWMNNKLWRNDPDCLVARSHCNGIEYQEFRKFFPTMEITESEFGLTDNEFEAFAKLIWFTGSSYFLSDIWGELEDKRKELLEKLAVPLRLPVSMVDFYDKYDVSVMKTTAGALKIAVFNIGDEAEQITVNADKFGLSDACLKEMTRDVKARCESGRIYFPVIPPRTGYVFELEQEDK